MDVLDSRTKKEISDRIARLIKDMGIKEPPLDVDDVVEFLSMNKTFYDLEDPNLLQQIWHKLRIGKNHVKKIAKKISLKALYLPDSNEIAIDNTVPNTKEKWITAHEITHKLLPTHNQLLLGDTLETLDPYYQEMMETEANYGASTLIFLQDKFTIEAKDYSIELDSVFQLSSRYKNSKASTLRRFVEVNTNKPMAAMISTPYWTNNDTSTDRCRYFIQSPLFKKLFSSVSSDIILSIIDQHSYRCKGGPMGKHTSVLFDDNKSAHEFIIEPFFNKYDILTLITHNKLL